MMRYRMLCHGSAPVLLAIWLLAGCGTQPLQVVPPDQLGSVRNGSSAVALARVDCAVPVGGYFLIKPPTPQLPGVPTLELVLGDTDSAGAPRWSDSRKDFYLLPKEVPAEGWIALIKPPGYYYLHFVGIFGGYARNLAGWPPGKEGIAVGRVSDPLERRPTLRFELPPNAPLFYVGTFHVDCPTPEFEASVSVRSTTAIVENESEAAAAVARREFPSLPLPVTRLAVRQSGPILLGVPPADSE